MAGATRRSLPRCSQMVAKYDKHYNQKGEVECGKPAVAVWYWRAASDDPHYMCAAHEKQAMKEELEDELEREMEEIDE